MCSLNRRHLMMGQSIQTCCLRCRAILRCVRLLAGHLTFRTSRSSLRGCRRRRHRLPRELYGFHLNLYGLLWTCMDVYDLYCMDPPLWLCIWTCMNLYERVWIVDYIKCSLMLIMMYGLFYEVSVKYMNCMKSLFDLGYHIRDWN